MNNLADGVSCQDQQGVDGECYRGRCVDPDNIVEDTTTTAPTTTEQLLQNCPQQTTVRVAVAESPQKETVRKPEDPLKDRRVC